MQADYALEYKQGEGAEEQFSSSRDGSMDSALGLGIGAEERESSGPAAVAAAPFAAPPSLSGCPITRLSHAWQRVINGVSSCAALDPCLPLLSLLSSLQMRASVAVSLVGALLLWRGRSLELTAIAGANSAYWSPLPQVNDFLYLGVRVSVFFALLRPLVQAASLRPLAAAKAAAADRRAAAPTATPMERCAALCIVVTQLVDFGLLVSQYHALPSLEVVLACSTAPGVPLSVSAPITAHLAWCLRFASIVMHLHTLVVAALLGMTAAVLVRREVFKDLDHSQVSTNGSQHSSPCTHPAACARWIRSHVEICLCTFFSSFLCDVRLVLQLCASLCDDLHERLATLPSAGALLSRACTRLCGGVTRDDAINAAPKSKCSFAASPSATSCPHAIPSTAASASAAASAAAASSTAATAATPMCPFRVATGAAGKARILTGCVVASLQELALRIQPALESVIRPQHHPSPASSLHRTRPGQRPSCIESFLTPVPESALETSTTPLTPVAASPTQKQTHAHQPPPSSVASHAPAADGDALSTFSSSSSTHLFDLTAASSYPPADTASSSSPAESSECASSSSSLIDSSDDGFVLVDADFTSE